MFSSRLTAPPQASKPFSSTTSTPSSQPFSATRTSEPPHTTQASKTASSSLSSSATSTPNKVIPTSSTSTVSSSSTTTTTTTPSRAPTPSPPAAATTAAAATTTTTTTTTASPGTATTTATTTTTASDSHDSSSSASTLTTTSTYMNGVNSTTPSKSSHVSSTSSSTSSVSFSYEMEKAEKVVDLPKFIMESELPRLVAKMDRTQSNPIISVCKTLITTFVPLEDDVEDKHPGLTNKVMCLTALLLNDYDESAWGAFFRSEIVRTIPTKPLDKRVMLVNNLCSKVINTLYLNASHRVTAVITNAMHYVNELNKSGSFNRELIKLDERVNHVDSLSSAASLDIQKAKEKIEILQVEVDKAKKNSDDVGNGLALSLKEIEDVKTAVEDVKQKVQSAESKITSIETEYSANIAKLTQRVDDLTSQLHTVSTSTSAAAAPAPASSSSSSSSTSTSSSPEREELWKLLEYLRPHLLYQVKMQAIGYETFMKTVNLPGVMDKLGSAFQIANQFLEPESNSEPPKEQEQNASESSNSANTEHKVSDDHRDNASSSLSLNPTSTPADSAAAALASSTPSALGVTVSVTSAATTTTTTTSNKRGRTISDIADEEDYENIDDAAILNALGSGDTRSSSSSSRSGHQTKKQALAAKKSKKDKERD